MEKLLFIYNPQAGKGQVRSKLAEVLNVFTQAGWLVTAYPTQAPGDAARIARAQGGRFRRLAVCGGDGTLHEVITGLMDLPREKRPVIGYLPAGTTNDFARNLSLPKTLGAMAATAVGGVPRAVDLGRLGESYFTYVAAFGAFVDVAYNTPQRFKNFFGHLAYVLKGVTELKSLKSYELTVDYGGEVLEGSFLFGMVSNTVSVGGLLGLPKEEVALDDGLLEAVLIRTPKTLAELNLAILALAKQEYSAESGVVGLHAARFTITCAEPIPYTLDGEFGGEHARAELEAVDRPVEILYGK